MHDYHGSPYVVYFIILIILIIFIFCVIYAGCEGFGRCGSRKCDSDDSCDRRKGNKKGGRNSGAIALGITFLFLIFIVGIWWWVR